MHIIKKILNVNICLKTFVILYFCHKCIYQVYYGTSVRILFCNWFTNQYNLTPFYSKVLNVLKWDYITCFIPCNSLSIYYIMVWYRNKVLKWYNLAHNFFITKLVNLVNNAYLQLKRLYEQSKIILTPFVRIQIK